MKKYIIGLVLLGSLSGKALADNLQWQIPNFGLVNLNLTTSEALVGYDGIKKVALSGVSLPVYTDPKGIVTLQLGAVSPWQSNEATVQPYIAAGHDIAREIPILAQFKSLHLNVFGRYDSGNGKPGAGISFSYSFAQ